MVEWKMLHPRATLEMLGYIPAWLRVAVIQKDRSFVVAKMD